MLNAMVRKRGLRSRTTHGRLQKTYGVFTRSSKLLVNVMLDVCWTFAAICYNGAGCLLDRVNTLLSRHCTESVIRSKSEVDHTSLERYRMYGNVTGRHLSHGNRQRRVVEMDYSVCWPWVGLRSDGLR